MSIYFNFENKLLHKHVHWVGGERISISRNGTEKIWSRLNKYASVCSHKSSFWITRIKIGLTPFKESSFIWFNESPLKLLKNTFYFILKTLLFLNIFKLLSWYFAHVKKAAWLQRDKINLKIMASQPGY